MRFVFDFSVILAVYISHGKDLVNLVGKEGKDSRDRVTILRMLIILLTRGKRKQSMSSAFCATNAKLKKMILLFMVALDITVVVGRELILKLG
jgi:hypothetical protein